MLAEYGRRCWLQLDGCTGTATTGDHVESRYDRPELAYVVSNGRPACGPCNSKRGALDQARRARGVDAQLVDARAFFDSASQLGSAAPLVSPPDSEKTAETVPIPTETLWR